MQCQRTISRSSVPAPGATVVGTVRPAAARLRRSFASTGSSGARRAARLTARAEVEQAAATASGDQSDGEVPPGCARYTVELPKPLGLVLEEGPGGRGVYVAEIAAEGNAARLAPQIGVGDELIATSGMVYTSEQEYGEITVRGGEQVVRLNVRNNDFKTVMAAIGSIKPPRTVVLDFQSCT
ncbi:PDZ domain [Micractinium conductrix]|uniref:PDZ domain n=1 Tax=Micractinium conductrix TaxID=554055 RepID=A0A2P6V6V6_9CHLO|nr:PDZ domain [Micractinium conductrix]|eukprot:PSC69815.1 PDZ domain [Micractinium conductrix]